METSYDSLDELLTMAASKLDAAASMIRDLSFSSEANVRKLGEALVNIYEIQHDIYKLRPDLRPDFLKK